MDNFTDWLFFPSREWVNRDGARQFAVPFEFTNKDVHRRFQEAALADVGELADRVALGETP
jgi:hypothetical protein